ncbi:MAG: class SAM-dependent methyltransferase [Hyphomicrobiales bacterium]|nr:class SAM-dependent methyltransferase [Hyphomicrobiales bacterium]
MLSWVILRLGLRQRQTVVSKLDRLNESRAIFHAMRLDPAMAHHAARHIIDLYDRRATDWDRDRGKVLMEKGWLDKFVALLPSGGSILDIGCGSGDPVARYLIQQSYRVIGLDSSQRMIAMCERRFPDNEWIVADMRTIDLGRTYDGLLAWDSTFHLTPEDQEAVFSTFARHAHPGTAMMFTSGPEHGEAIGSWRGDELYHASLAPAEYRAALEANGFEIVDHVVEDETCGRHTVWLARAHGPSSPA